MALNPTKDFYGHRGETATLGFHELKSEYCRGSVGGREDFENVLELQEMKTDRNSFFKQRKSYRSIVRTQDTHSNWN